MRFGRRAWQAPIVTFTMPPPDCLAITPPPLHPGVTMGSLRGSSALTRVQFRPQCCDLRPEARQLRHDRVHRAAVGRFARRRLGRRLGRRRGETSRLARMLARAPMIPMPANMTKMPVRRPNVRDREEVPVADGGDRHDAPPDRIATGRMFASGAAALELEHEDAADAEHDPGQQDRDERRVLAAVLETSRTRSLPAWPRSSRVIRVSRLSRARRNRAVNGMKPKLGIDPRRSSQPRWPTKYARFGFEPREVHTRSPPGR